MNDCIEEFLYLLAIIIVGLSNENLVLDRSLTFLHILEFVFLFNDLDGVEGNA